MKLVSKNFNWSAGRPIVFLNEELMKNLNLEINDRIKLSLNKKNIYAIVDSFSKIVKKNEIGLSKEISLFLKNKNNQKIEVSTSQDSITSNLIKKKLNGYRLSSKEIKKIITDIVDNNLSESEIAFFLSAERLRGMSHEEIISLTKAMVSTGKQLKFEKKIIADKHCIGGIAGNRTTPIVISICAEAGLTLPKTSSRAITSAAGTADVVETISKIEFSVDEIKKIISKTNACLAWNGMLGLSPTDDKIIKVERILNLDVEPQLIASILSKKIAAGSNHILIDIPYGSGKMKTKKEAKKLGRKFKLVGKSFKLKIKTVYTKGYGPIGNGVGSILEMKDVISVLKNDKNSPQDLKEKAIFLASELMNLCGIPFSKIKARKILESGRAYEKFKQIINSQNNSSDFEKRVSNLKIGRFKKTIFANRNGKISSLSNNKINSLCRTLGCPESKGAGVFLYKKSGSVKKGDKLMELYSENNQKLKDAINYLTNFEPYAIN